VWLRETYCCEGLVAEGCMLIRDDLRGWCHHMCTHLGYKPPNSQGTVILVALVIVLSSSVGGILPIPGGGGAPQVSMQWVKR
jgi:hypothetical protein